MNKCNTCQCSKASTTRIADLLQPLELLEKEEKKYVNIDSIIDLTSTRQRHDALRWYLDKSSKMAHFISTITTKES